MQARSLVRLHRRFQQVGDGKPMMTLGKRLKAEDCLKFHKMLSSGLSAFAVLRPVLNRNLELASDQMKQRRQRELIHAEHNTGIAEVAELHCEAQPVRHAAALPNN